MGARHSFPFGSTAASRLYRPCRSPRSLHCISAAPAPLNRYLAAKASPARTRTCRSSRSLYSIDRARAPCARRILTPAAVSLIHHKRLMMRSYDKFPSVKLFIHRKRLMIRKKSPNSGKLQKLERFAIAGWPRRSRSMILHPQRCLSPIISGL